MLGEGFWGGSVTRKRELSDIRRQACLQRADRQGGAGDNAVETPDDDIDKEFSVDEEDEEDSEAGQQAKSSLSTMKRRKTDLLAMFPVNIVVQREVLKLLVQDFEVSNILIDQKKAADVNVHRSTIFRYRKDCTFFLQDCFLRFGIPPEDLLMFLAQQLVVKDHTGFFDHGLSFLNQQDIPVSLRVTMISDELADLMIKDRRNADCRKVSIKHAVEVAKRANLHHQKGQILTLATGIGSSVKFASKILTAVDEDKTEDLFKRKTRCTSICDTDIAARLTEFLANAEHSRALPGNETASVAYGRRKPKFLLK